DLSIVHAWMGDTEGNLVYRKTARNFNPMMATAGKVTVAEVEHLVQPGDLNPDLIITPGVYVKRLVHVPNAVKHIEQRTVRKRTAAPAETGEGGRWDGHADRRPSWPPRSCVTVSTSISVSASPRSFQTISPRA